jgi:hypothetical protein
MLTVLTPRVYREFKTKVEGEFKCWVSWSHHLGPCGGATVPRDVYKIRPMFIDGRLREFDATLANIILRDVLCDVAGDYPDEASVLYHPARTRAAANGFGYTPELPHATLVLHTPFGPMAPPGILGEIAHQHEYNDNWHHPDTLPTSVRRTSTRWKPGEQVIVPKWRPVNGGPRLAYYLASFNQLHGQTAYRVLKETDSAEYNQEDNDLRVCFLWDTSGPSGPGVGNCHTDLDVLTVNWNVTEPYYQRQYFVVRSVKKIEKFFPEGDR